MQDLILCKNCRHLLAPEKDGRRERCGHDSAVIIDHVNGNHSRLFAQTHRSYNGKESCGHAAQFFEPKQAQALALVESR